MIESLLLKIKKRYRLSEAEERMLRDSMTEELQFGVDEIIVPEGKKVSFSCLLVEGFACRSKYMNGGERQIMEFHIAGDFVDLHSYSLEWLDHSITALSPCRIVKLAHADIARIVSASPRLGRIFWFMTLVDAAIHREWLVSLGRRTAIQRLANLFCEMHYRLEIVGQSRQDSYSLPLIQAELAEALGLTHVHINRTLRKLTEQGLVKFRGGKVTILDLEGLEALAEFDKRYLYLEKRDS